MSFVGTYQFRPTGEETVDYYLVLNQDGTALLEEKPIVSEPAGSALSVDATGNWHPDGDTVEIEFITVHGEPAVQQETVRIRFEGGFPILSDIKVGDKFVHLENGAFSVGAGEQHPLVPEINRRLARIQWLGFTDPGTDVYGEETRQAVVAFQEAQGLLPNGVVDAETWLLLDNPKPPLPTPTPLPSTAGRITSVPNLDDLPDHTGDGQPILYLTFDDGPLPQNTSATTSPTIPGITPRWRACPTRNSSTSWSGRGRPSWMLLAISLRWTGTCATSGHRTGPPMPIRGSTRPSSALLSSYGTSTPRTGGGPVPRPCNIFLP
jgi:hypothetical protein